MRQEPTRRAPARKNAMRVGATVVFWLFVAVILLNGGRHVSRALRVAADAPLPASVTAEIRMPAAAAATAQTGKTADLRMDRAPDSAPPASQAHGPAIAIVIDDLGADVEATRRAIRLPAAVTLSFLPYPDMTPALAHEGKERGHQILVHEPMEPVGTEDPGPNALLAGLPPAEIERRLLWAFDRVPGFSGMNNHMGSRFTADRASLLPVIQVLAGRHLFFLDSRTTAQTVVVPMAREFGVASAGRDVFLDDEQSAGAVEAQLALTERVARTQGTAIAIGHPHAVTLAALEAWTASLEGFRLISVSMAIRRKSEHPALMSEKE